MKEKYYAVLANRVKKQYKVPTDPDFKEWTGEQVVGICLWLRRYFGRNLGIDYNNQVYDYCSPVLGILPFPTQIGRFKIFMISYSDFYNRMHVKYSILNQERKELWVVTISLYQDKIIVYTANRITDIATCQIIK